MPLALATALSMQANDYLVTNRTVASGENYYFAGMKFTGGVDILNSLTQIPNYAESGDNFWFESGTYEGNVTISASNITLYGANRYGDSRTSTRPNAESIIKGKITINGSGLTINGFAFTGSGCVYNNSATSAAPLNGFTFIYNNVYGETLARERNTAVIRFGTARRGSDAGNADAQVMVGALGAAVHRQVSPVQPGQLFGQLGHVGAVGVAALHHQRQQGVGRGRLPPGGECKMQ